MTKLDLAALQQISGGGKAPDCPPPAPTPAPAPKPAPAPAANCSSCCS